LVIVLLLQSKRCDSRSRQARALARLSTVAPARMRAVMSLSSQIRCSEATQAACFAGASRQQPANRSQATRARASHHCAAVKLEL
jgi:hypothetical protein